MLAQNLVDGIERDQPTEFLGIVAVFYIVTGSIWLPLVAIYDSVQ